MPIGYPKELRDAAEGAGRHLATLAASGVDFQGAATSAERAELLRFLLPFVDRVEARAAGGGPDAEDRR